MQCLGMAQERISLRNKVSCKLLKNLLLRLTIEVDDDVATENNVGLLRKPIVGVHKVEPAELHMIAQFGDDTQEVGATGRGCA